MVLNNNYYSFINALSPKFCDDVIKYALYKKDELARIGGYDKNKLSENEILDIKKIRNSNIVWLDESWIYKELHPYINEANKQAGWNFEWSFTEHCQFTKYNLNQYYDWHCDSHSDPYNKPNTPSHGKIRKLSMTCQLTDGSEYEGGELEFDYRHYNPVMRDESQHKIQCKEILPKGSIVVFPSFVWHRVKPVTKGVRYSLVAWNLGRPFS
jgi:PKHD-type hydroxylase